jgi:hypothetical protein
MIFQNYNIDFSWDGTYGGVMSPDGVYTYVVNYKPKSGDAKTLTGHVTLLR